MIDTASDTSTPPKRRKTRPPRGRGLRTNTGCLTCRQRRLKCDEAKPCCGQCNKSSRDCVYSQDQPKPSDGDLALKSPTGVPLANEWRQRSGTPSGTRFGHTRRVSSDIRFTQLNSQNNVASTNVPLQLSSARSYIPSAEISSPSRSPSGFRFSPLTQTSSLTPAAAPYDWYDWYDLLAQDAVKNIDNYNFLTNSGSRWSFESSRLYRNSNQSNTQFAHEQVPSVDRSLTLPRPALVRDDISDPHSASVNDPWNTSEPPSLRETELKHFQFFINVVGPTMDLFDSTRPFTNLVPHLALRNVGLLKSLLAVSARYEGILLSGKNDAVTQNVQSPNSSASQILQDEDMGVQYYYETLSYLSQAMQYPSYTRSTELVTTALLISCYEALASESSMDWERHLKGVFWIQRSQDNNGERHGLPGAVWWHWLRQDIWAALKHGRKTLTIWKPTKPLSSLTSEELARRVLYLQAKAVSYASDEAGQTSDLQERIEKGDTILRGLQDWYHELPRAFKPLPPPKKLQSKSIFPPLWIHPPIYAAAMQAYSSAKILILLNKPSVGGVFAYHNNQKMLDEAVRMICGIAQAPNAFEMPSALVNVQALSIAGQCVRTKIQQDVLAELLDRTLDVTKFPSKKIIDDLQSVWLNDT